MSHSSFKIQHGIREGLEEYHLLKIEGRPWTAKTLFLLHRRKGPDPFKVSVVKIPHLQLKGRV
jgi:hypothetical protein